MKTGRGHRVAYYIEDRQKVGYETTVSDVTQVLLSDRRVCLGQLEFGRVHLLASKSIPRLGLQNSPHSVPM